MDAKQLRDALVDQLANGRLAHEYLFPAIRELSVGVSTGASLAELHELLEERGGAVVRQLAGHIETLLIEIARSAGDAARDGRTPSDSAEELADLCLPTPQPWSNSAVGFEALVTFLHLARHRRFAEQREDGSEDTRKKIDGEWAAARTRLETLPVPWLHPSLRDLLRELGARGTIDAASDAFLHEQCRRELEPSGERQQLSGLTSEFHATQDREIRTGILDQLLEWPTDLASDTLSVLGNEPWARLRIAVGLAHRFGEPDRRSSLDFKHWLIQQGMPLGTLESKIQKLRHDLTKPVEVAEFNARFHITLPSVTTGWKPTPTEAAPDEPAPATPTRPQKPSAWRTQLQPFFADNWYIFAGLIMLLAGCSIVAYYTWDRHWLWRYTLLPVMLGGFTMGLAGLGTWLEKRSEEFGGTAAVLRGAAIGLLPVNFMTVAFLADDPQVEGRLLFILLAAGLYLGCFGWGLRRWCAAVFAPLGTLLGGALLLLNALVIARPIADTIATGSGSMVPAVLGVGFHAGFLALAAVIVHFTRTHLTRELAEEKRVPWFVGGTLIATFLQVFAWVYTSMGRLPQAHSYAPMTILAGGLLLYVERRALALREEPTRHSGESFLGFAVIFLGCLMAQGHDVVRIIGFALAGVVWLYQAEPRRHPAHTWIGLGLLTLAGASIGLVDGFPSVWRPTLGLGLALCMHAIVQRAAANTGDTARGNLALAAAGMRNTIVFLTAVVAVLGQWHDRSSPLATAAYLVAAAAFLTWLAHREGRVHLMHVAMVLIALVLPYIGCVDLDGRSLQGNTIVFGLAVVSCAWSLVNWLVPTRITMQARSTVLWTYGALAVVGMVLRVVFEREMPGEVAWYQMAMGFAGPLLMSGVLVFAGYFSRSLVPSAMAGVIVIILFPEIKARFATALAQLGWGSGLGSSVTAVVLTIVCFYLARWRKLQVLTPGDRFLGRFNFPLRRFDHTLFTWPLLVSTVFLIVRVDTWTLYKNLASGLSQKTAWAVFLTGVTWTGLAAYAHRVPRAKLCTHLGWISFGLGIALLYGARLEGRVFRLEVPVVQLGVLLQGLYFLYRYLQQRHSWVGSTLLAPTLAVLRVGSVFVTVGLMLFLVDGSQVRDSGWLAAFLVVQLLWHGIAQQRVGFGGLLFALAVVVIAAGSTPDTGYLPAQLRPEWHASPLLVFLLVVQAMHLGLEAYRTSKHATAGPPRLASVALPFQVGSLLLVAAFCALWLLESELPQRLTTAHKGMLLGTLVLSARANRAAPLLLAAVLLGYAWMCQVAGGATFESARVLYLITPWRLALLAFCLAGVQVTGTLIHARAPRLVAGGWPMARFPGTGSQWLLWPATVAAALSALLFTTHPLWRGDTGQLGAPWLGAAALALVGRGWRRTWPVAGAGILVAIGNVQAVRLLFADHLLDRGLSEVHLVCLGLVATLILISFARLALSTHAARRGIDRGCMALAGTTLVLLAANYVLRHDLQDITPFRFVISGLLAWLSSLAFRHVARDLSEEDPHHTDLCEAAYHFGVTIALWCAALLVPPLRGPHLALLALSLPVYYFAARAEASWRAGSPFARRYRNSAAVIGCVLLGLYAFRWAFQLVLFPGELVQTSHYHHGSPFIILLGLVLLRLHRMGAGYWMAFYGGLAVMGGSYFAVTALPGMTPFDHPIAGAFVGILAAHFWTMATNQHSPLRTGLQTLGGIGDDVWLALRGAWGHTLFVAAQILVVIAVFNHGQQSRAVAPLLAGAASIAVHHGLLRGRPWYHALAGVLLAVALHADVLVDSYLDRDNIVWVLLGAWAVALVGAWSIERVRQLSLGRAFAAVAGLAFLHALYHHPSSATGVWIVACIGMLAAAVPRSTTAATSPGETIAAGLLLLVPTWTVFFGHAPAHDEVVTTTVLAWPLLTATATALLTGVLAWACQSRVADGIQAMRTPCLGVQSLNLMRVHGNRGFALVAVIALGVAAALQITHYRAAFAPRELALLCGLYAGLAYTFYSLARELRSALAFAVMELCLFALFLAIRRQLLLTTGAWTAEYDVWASLVVAFLLTGTRQLIGPSVREVALPLTVSLVGLPVISMGITIFNGLGTDVALLVVGLHSLMFSYLGKNEGESPWNILAVSGFVTFVVVLFWSKMELHVVHAYVLPVGLGILVLLQLFRGRLSIAQRNNIRLVTLLSMIGSSGYYALADPRYPVGFHMILLLLCLAAMGLGGFLRIRLYVQLGFTGLLVSLGSIVYRALSGLDRSPKMTAVGLMVLVIGAALVAGAIYYKTHRDIVNTRIDAWRRRFGEWE